MKKMMDKRQTGKRTDQQKRKMTDRQKTERKKNRKKRNKERNTFIHLAFSFKLCFFFLSVHLSRMLFNFLKN